MQFPLTSIVYSLFIHSPRATEAPNASSPLNVEYQVTH
jgi:hypothetical protein